ARRRGRGRAALDQRQPRRPREERDREEGLREAAPDRQEARRGRRAAPRPHDREVHERRAVRTRGPDARHSARPAASFQLQPPMRVGATATSSYHIWRVGPWKFSYPNLKYVKFTVAVG